MLVPMAESYELERGLDPAPVRDMGLVKCVQKHPTLTPATDGKAKGHHEPGLGACAQPHAARPVLAAHLPRRVPPARAAVGGAAAVAARHACGHAVQVRLQAVLHGVPALVCAPARALNGFAISFFIDAYGRVLQQQTGGVSFVAKVVLDYHGGRPCAPTGWEARGSRCVFAWILSLLAVQHPEVPAMMGQSRLLEWVPRDTDDLYRLRKRAIDWAP
ncbi:hypothetical protein Q5752_002521 [Cryptotrichosporon argae]